MLCSVVKHLASGRALKKWGKHSTASRVFPYTSFVLYRFLRALQQNRAQSRLLYLLITRNFELEHGIKKIKYKTKQNKNKTPIWPTDRRKITSCAQDFNNKSCEQSTASKTAIMI